MDVDIHSVITELRRVGRHRAVESLVSNRQNQQIIFSGNAFHAVDARTGALQVQSGLTRPLRRNYWPHTNMSNILRTPSSSNSSSGTQHTKKKSHFKKQQQRRDKKQGKTQADPQTKKQKKGYNIGKGRFFGSVQGTQVQHELEDFILLDEENFNKKYNGAMHPWTKRILEYLLLERRWYPIQCEFKVGDTVKRLATAIDIICVDPANGHLVFIELKTGHSGYFENCDGYMAKCLSFMRNSPLNWANVQLTASVQLLQRQNPSLRLSHTSSYVIRIDEENMWVYELDNGFIRMMTPRLLDELDMTLTDDDAKPKRKKAKPKKKPVKRA